MDLSLDADLRAIITMSENFGKHRALVWAYAELFGITPMRAKAKKLRILLEDVKRLFDAGQFTFQKKRYGISTNGIIEALNTVVRRNFSNGLDGHNYLKKVMITIAEREAQEAGKNAEKDLRRREGKAMTGDRDPGDGENRGPAVQLKSMPPGFLSEEQIEENKRRVKDVLKTIG